MIWLMAVGAERPNYERQISTAISQASVDAFRQVFGDIQSLAATQNSQLPKNKVKAKVLLALFGLLNIR